MVSSTALQIVASAYKQANMDQTVSSFSMTDFPYNCAMDLLNTVIQEMNGEGHYWFTETSTTLTYSVGVYQYTYASIGSGVDPKGILRIRKEATDHKQELKEVNYRYFQQHFRRSDIQTGEPLYWSKYGNQLEFNCIPDQDYTTKIYYLRDMPLITAASDTLLCPETDEHVFREGVYAYLLNRLKRPDWQSAYEFYWKKVNSLLADQKQDVGLPRQMPAAF